MELISFIFKSRLKFYFTGKGSGYRTAGLIFFSAVAVLYGVMMGFAIDALYSGGGWPASAKDFFLFINVIVLSQTISRAYLPSYKPRIDIFSPIVPLAKAKKYYFGLMVDFIYPFFFINLLFLITVKLASAAYSFTMLAGAVVLLYSAQMIRRILQFLLERSLRVKLHEIIINSAVLLISCFFIFRLNILSQVKTGTELLMSIGAALMLTGADYILTVSASEYKRSVTGKLMQRNIFNSFSGTFLFKSPSARKALLIAIALKTLLLTGDYFAWTYNGKHIFSIYLMWGVYASPLILFSYLYSNTWGFYRNLWLTIEKSASGLQPLLRVQLKIMMLPYLADFIISGIYFIVCGQNVVSGFIFYAFALFFIISFAIFASVADARVIDKAHSYRNNSSIGWKLAAISVIMGLVALTQWPQYMWAVIPFIIAAVFMLNYLSKNYPKYKYGMYQKLFKSGV